MNGALYEQFPHNRWNTRGHVSVFRDIGRFVESARNCASFTPAEHTLIVKLSCRLQIRSAADTTLRFLKGVHGSMEKATVLGEQPIRLGTDDLPISTVMQAVNNKYAHIETSSGRAVVHIPAFNTSGDVKVSVRNSIVTNEYMRLIHCSCVIVTMVAPRFSLRRPKWRDLSAAST